MSGILNKLVNWQLCTSWILTRYCKLRSFEVHVKTGPCLLDNFFILVLSVVWQLVGWLLSIHKKKLSNTCSQDFYRYKLTYTAKSSHDAAKTSQDAAKSSKTMKKAFWMLPNAIWSCQMLSEAAKSSLDAAKSSHNLWTLIER